MQQEVMESKIHEKKVYTKNPYNQKLLSCTLCLQSRLVQLKNCTSKQSQLKRKKEKNKLYKKQFNSV